MEKRKIYVVTGATTFNDYFAGVVYCEVFRTKEEAEKAKEEADRKIKSTAPVELEIFEREV